jgi:hypothetical protein
MGRGYGLVALALVAGCCPIPTSFSSPEREVQSRFFTISTDVNPTSSLDVAFLDTAVARVTSALGEPLPEPASLTAVLFAKHEDFTTYSRRHWIKRAGGFYCPLGGEIALSMGALEMASFAKQLDDGVGRLEVTPEFRKQCPDLAQKLDETNRQLDELDEVSKTLAHALRQVDQIFQVEDLRTIVHEITHQLMHASGTLTLSTPHWVQEGVAEFEAQQAMRPEDLRETTRDYWKTLNFRHEMTAWLTLAVRALYGQRAFAHESGLRRVTWADDNYAAHLGLVEFFSDYNPDARRALCSGTVPPLSKSERVQIETSIARWARIRASECLLVVNTPEALDVLAVMWDSPRAESHWKTIIETEKGAYQRGQPSEHPLALHERVGWLDHHDAILAKTRLALAPALTTVLRFMESSIDLDDLEAGVRE